MTLHIMPDLDLLAKGWCVEQAEDQFHDEPFFLYSKGHYIYLREYEAKEVEAAAVRESNGQK